MESLLTISAGMKQNEIPGGPVKVVDDRGPVADVVVSNTIMVGD